MSAIDEYGMLDATALAELVRTRQVKPAELLDEAMRRVERLDPKLNAVSVKVPDIARADIATGLPEGPFRGVPFLLKDLGAYAKGITTNGGSRFLAGIVPTYDSAYVARLRAAGLVLFGRTTSPEIGLAPTTEARLYGGPTRNPWNGAHTAGGSSGGACAAVAAGIVPMAHATDGGGSIRIPASCCGLFGLKPTRGRNPAGPDRGEGWAGFACEHVVSWTVRDSAAALDATAGPDTGAPYHAPPPEREFIHELCGKPGRMRLAVSVKPTFPTAVDPECAAAARDAARLLQGLGHHVEEADLPEIDPDALSKAFWIVVGVGAAMVVADRARALGRSPGADDLEPVTRATISVADRTSALDYVSTLRWLHTQSRRIARFFETYDALITPVLATPPIEHGVVNLMIEDRDEYERRLNRFMPFTQVFNMTGQPAASVPLAMSKRGLPIGVQIAARYGDEATIFRLAAQFEAARPWVKRRPKV